MYQHIRSTYNLFSSFLIVFKQKIIDSSRVICISAFNVFYDCHYKQMVIDIAEQALGKAKELTPVQTGRLRDAWNLGTIEKRGDTYYIEIYNNVEYAEPVEYGHRMKGGGFKKGAHMLEVSLQEMDRKLPDYLRAWLADFLNTHDLV